MIKKILCFFGFHSFKTYSFERGEDTVSKLVGAVERKDYCVHCYLKKSYWYGLIQ